MAAADASRPLGATSNLQGAPRASHHAASLLARFNQRAGSTAESGVGTTETKAEDPCKGPFGDLIRAQLPPLDPQSTEMTVAFGQRFPRWQPVDRPASQLPNVWAYAEEMRIGVPAAAVLAEGWTSLEQFLSSWLANLRAVPRGQGAVGFAARMVVDRIASPIGVHPGAVLRCDLPSVAGAGVELADFEIVDVQPTFARLGTLTAVGPHDGAVYRHPFCGVWELGFFRGVRADTDPEDADASATQPSHNVATFYVRSLYAPDDEGVQAAGVYVGREAWASFLQGLGERFGMHPMQARTSLRGIGGSADAFHDVIQATPECFTPQMGPGVALAAEPGANE